MPDIHLLVTPPVAPLVTIKPASVFVSLGNVVGAVGAGSSQYSVQGTGTPGNPYQLVGDAATPGNWQFYGTNGSGVKGWLAQGASTQFSLTGTGVPGTPLQLSGDVASPGNNQFYGTNNSGTRGFYPLTGSVETLVNTNLGTGLTAAQSVNCAGACAVHINLGISASLTLTLTNLLPGIPVSIACSSSGAFTLKLAATSPTSVAYAITGFTGGASLDMVGTGLALTATTLRCFVGNSYGGATPTLQMTY